MPKKKQVSAAQKTSMTKPKKRKPSQRKELWTPKIVGEKLDLSRDQVRNILNRIEPYGKEGSANVYLSSKVLEAASKVAKRKPGNTEDKDELEKEKLRQQIRKLTVDADEAEGQVIQRDEVFQGFYEFGAQVRKHLSEQIDKLPPLLAGLTPPGMQVKIRDYNEDILEKLRRHKYSKLDS